MRVLEVAAGATAAKGVSAQWRPECLLRGYFWREWKAVLRPVGLLVRVDCERWS